MMVVKINEQAPSRPINALFVEDDADFRQGLADYLRLRSIDVTEASCGLEYYKATRDRRYDVAIVDVNLPDISGFDLARDLSANGATGVVMLTARDEIVDRIHGRSAGADSYLTKPVDGEELILTIQNLVRRMKQDRQGAVEPPVWHLCLPAQRLISPDAQEIPLTGRELLLMEHFARAAYGSTISRSVLVQSLGYGNLAPESRSLDAVVRRLRQKTLDLGCDLPLQSVHAVGIRFLAPLVIT